MNQFKIQLVDRPIGAFSGPAITGAGGMVMVCAQGSASKQTIKDATGAAITNPVPFTRGGATFYTDNANPKVDLYVMAPDGQFAVLFAAQGDTLKEVPIDRSKIDQTALIPFSIADSVAATEKDTGMILPAGALVLPDVGIRVDVIETTGAKTIDFGTLSTGSGGVAAGFGSALSTATLGVVAAKSASTATRGTNVGGGTLDRGYSTDSQTGRNISYTLVTGSVAAKGVIFLPYLNLGTGQPTI